MKKKFFLSALAMTVALPVIVAPVQAAEVSQDFIDVSKSHSFYKEIMTMRDENIIKGYTDNTFKPTQAISRVHVASLFVRSLDLTPIRQGKEFDDVPKTHPYYAEIQKVYRAGIFDGNSTNNFGVNDNLTRAQMAKVLAHALKLREHKGYIFEDVSADHWAKDYIAALYMSGITVGSNGKFLPNDSVTRAHYAAFLYRALHPEDAPKPEKPLQPTPPVVEPKPPVEKPNTPGKLDPRYPVPGWLPPTTNAKTTGDSIKNAGLLAKDLGYFDYGNGNLYYRTTVNPHITPTLILTGTEDTDITMTINVWRGSGSQIHDNKTPYIVKETLKFYLGDTNGLSLYNTLDAAYNGDKEALKKVSDFDYLNPSTQKVLKYGNRSVEIRDLGNRVVVFIGEPNTNYDVHWNKK